LRQTASPSRAPSELGQPSGPLPCVALG